MNIVVRPGYFRSEEQAYDELESNGLFVMEMDVPAVDNRSHWHTFSTRIYILEGELLITDSARDKTLKAGPGSRVDVPERVLHSEKSSGYKIIAGTTVDPATLTGPINLNPSEL